MRWEKLQMLQQQQREEQGEVNSGGNGGSGPGDRWGHTCNSIKGGRFLYVFGGFGNDYCQTNLVHVFDTVNQTWNQPVINGLPPKPRDSHSCTNVDDNLFVFGGTDGRNTLGDLHILDTSSHTWISPPVRGEVPEAREGHGAALVGNRLFIFGGCGKSSETDDDLFFNDVFILNTEKFTWRRAMTSGIPPSPRDSHTCSSWNNQIIVIAGEDWNDYYLSDVHILDAETLVWKQVYTSGQRLPPRAGHCTISLGRHLIVFGGFTNSQNLYDDIYMLEVDTGEWTKLMALGDGPSPRFSAAGDCLDPVKAGVIVLTGGCNKNLEALDDMYYLYTGLSSKQDEMRQERLSLKKQLKVKCQEQVHNSSVHDKALVRVDTNTDFQRAVPTYAQPSPQNFWPKGAEVGKGKKTFEARVTENSPLGYRIETVIDGKPLRGILFPNRPSSLQMSDNKNRKRAGRETDIVVWNGEHRSESKVARTR